MIPINRPSIRRKDMDSVLTCMVDDSLGPGDRSTELVNAVSQHIGLGGGVALRESSRAVTLAFNLLNLPDGSRVATDPLIPFTYHRVLTSLGLEPAYVDVEEDGVCLDARKVEEADAAAILSRTVFGFVPDLKRIAGLGLPVVEDISEGIGAHTGDRKVGAYGRVVIVSLEPDAMITAGGGVLLLAETKADGTRLGEAAAELAGDVFLPDMNAALGLTQIRELERFVARRSELAAIFNRAVMRGRHSVPVQAGEADNVHFAFPVLVEGGVPDIVQYSRRKGVDTALAFGESAFARLGLDGGEFPNARAMAMRCLRFPLFPALSGTEASVVERVLSTLP